MCYFFFLFFSFFPTLPLHLKDLKFLLVFCSVPGIHNDLFFFFLKVSYQQYADWGSTQLDLEKQQKLVCNPSELF